MTHNLNLWRPTLAAVLAAKPRATPSASVTFLRHVGGIGLVPLAILDSSIIPTFGSLDLLTAWLAALTPGLWLYYAAMSTTGALIGAVITYRMGRKLGTEWMEKKVGAKRVRQVDTSIKRWGFGAIFVPCIAPPPFPTSWFFLGAGAFSFPMKKFIIAVLLGRSLRYGLLTLVAEHYGSHFLRYLRHPTRYIVISLIVSAALIFAAYLFSGKKKTSWRAATTTGN
jgi:membrane protein YqaA with SNARE-associated domain